MLKILLYLFLIMLSGCTSWHYRTENDSVIFSIESWNHDPLDYVVEAADIKSFESFGNGYAKDNQRVYYRGKNIQGADPRTFVALNDYYSKDMKSVFINHCKIEKADPNTFRQLDKLWSTDGLRIYHGFSVVPDIDVIAFRSLSNYWAVDDKLAYHALPVITAGCSKPSISTKGTIFHGIDIKTFEVIDDFNANDRYYNYYGLKHIKRKR